MKKLAFLLVSIAFCACSAQHSVKGTYTGMLPCADCSGIKTTVTLDKNNTYSKTTEYFGKKEALISVETGAYSFDKNSSIVTLKNNNKKEYWQHAGPKELKKLDMQGKPMDSTLNYSIKKK